MADEDNDPLDVETVKGELAAFLERNADASIAMRAEAKSPVVEMPWGDPSVSIRLPHDEAERADLAKALNTVLLPSRLSAIYHTDIKSLEVIYTARAVSERLREISERRFKFHFAGVQMNCYFGHSSARLLSIAKNSFYPQASATGFRNLMSFTDYVELPHASEEEESEIVQFVKSQFDKPLSFYVEPIDWHDEDTLSVLRHISFYLRYYDSISPIIVIHPLDDSMSVNPKERYLLGQFPEEISSRQLNPTLLSFWMAAADAATENKFLYCFRIIEFVSSNYLKNEKLAQVKKVLSNPALLSSIETSIDALVGLIRDEGRQEVNRFKAVVSDLVRKEVIWPDICANPQAFTQEVIFDGGFVLPKLVDDVDDIGRFGPTTMNALAGHFRDIRNALAHGGEIQAGKVILPTAKNAKLLQPWAHLIVAVAGEVVLHENHT